MALVVRCPDCRKKFAWKSGTDLPDDCPLCGSHVGSDRPDDEIVMPSLRSARTAVADKVYRDMEKGSEHRANLAAEVGGGTAADYSGLKITDMRDNLRAGEIAAVTPNLSPQMQQFMAANPNAVGFRSGNELGLQLSQGSFQGPEPSAGARMRTKLQQYHADISQGAAVSDRPANEVMQPGYRRRG